MSIIPLGTDDLQSKDENASRIRLENMYLIDSPLSPDGISRVSRPTLTQVAEIAGSKAYGSFQKDGVFEGYAFVVIDTTLYQISLSDFSYTAIGTIPGTGYVQWAGGSISTGPRLLILRDEVVYSWDGSSLTQVNMPDSVGVGSITYLENYYFLSVIDQDTERGRFYWISPGSTDPDPLDFATAERQPDDLVSVTALGDELWMLGSQSGEVWIASGNSDSPFQAVQARAYNYGCDNPDSVIETTMGGTPAMAWITDNRVVAMASLGNAPSRISNESVEELLKTATNLRGWGFQYNRHSFLAFSADQFTVVYDLNKQTWSRWSSFMTDYFRAHLGFQYRQEVYAVDNTSGKIFHFEEGTDDLGDPVIRLASGLYLSQKNFEPCSRVNVIMNSGWTQDYGPTAVLELQWSDDLGFTWGPWVQIPMGQKGQYKTDVTFSGLGMIRRPGRLFQFRFSDKSRFRLDYATMNEM